MSPVARHSIGVGSLSPGVELLQARSCVSALENSAQTARRSSSGIVANAARISASASLLAEFVDEGVSGTKERRPALDRLLAEVKKRRFDVVLVWRFDRFARSTRFLVEALALFKALGVQFASFQENLDTSTPMGEAMFTIVAAISKLERDIIAERVRAGLRRAKAEGKRLGRQPLRVDPRRLEDVLSRKVSVREGARQLGVSRASFWRLARAHVNGAAITTEAAHA